MAVWTVRAAYDVDAKIWYTFDSDVPGLITSGKTIERLRERAAAVLPELLELNGHLIDDKTLLEEPHQLHLIAFHESTLPVAA